MTAKDSIRFWICLVCATLASGAIVANVSRGVGSSAQVNPLQPEPGKSILSRRCTNCHGLELVRESSKSLAEWKETIKLMVEYGATLAPPEQGLLTEYLAKHFGPKSPSLVSDGTKPEGKGTPSDEPGRSILSRRCTNCHGLELVRESSKSLAEWKETIKLMVEYGATLAPPEQGVLAEYLARHFGPKPSSLVSGGAEPEAKEIPSDEPGASILSRRCTHCHGLELVRESSKSVTEWREIINTMVEYGATLAASEQGVLAEYLARHFGIEQKADGH